MRMLSHAAAWLFAGLLLMPAAALGQQDSRGFTPPDDVEFRSE